MNAQEYNFSELLEKAESEMGITPELLAHFTKIPESDIKSYPPAGDVNERVRREFHHVADTLALLLGGFAAGEDSFLRSHIQRLEALKIPRQSIAKFIGIDTGKLTDFLDNTSSVSKEEKYKIAVGFLHMENLLTKNPYLVL